MTPLLTSPFAPWPRLLRALVAALLLAGMVGCQRPCPAEGCERGGAVSPTVQKANADMAAQLQLSDPQDLQDARRGLIARPTGKIVAAEGTVLRDFGAYGFLDGPAPATVNPSLWRHAQLNAQVGLFKVTDGVWQLRGFGQ